jgi:hypothetical protein
MADRSSRGGAREGAGRPLLNQTRTRRRSVTLAEHHWRWLDAKGNASATLRGLVEIAMDSESIQRDLDDYES